MFVALARRFMRSVFLFIGACLVLCAPAQAAQRERPLRMARVDPGLAELQSAPLQTFGTTSVPFGWAEFCQRSENKGDCAVEKLEAVAIVLDRDLLRRIDRVNRFVNDAIEPVTDIENYGVEEFWAYPDNGKGDCEDYVLLKRRMLMQAGVPRQALLITIVRDRAGEGHAVLTVKTSEGDLVLDNKTNRIEAAGRSPYLFVKRQSDEDPNVWVSLRERGAPVLAAAGTATAGR